MYRPQFAGVYCWSPDISDLVSQLYQHLPSEELESFHGRARSESCALAIEQVFPSRSARSHAMHWTLGAVIAYTLVLGYSIFGAANQPDQAVDITHIALHIIFT